MPATIVEAVDIDQALDGGVDLWNVPSLSTIRGTRIPIIDGRRAQFTDERGVQYTLSAAPAQEYEVKAWGKVPNEVLYWQVGKWHFHLRVEPTGSIIGSVVRREDRRLQHRGVLLARSYAGARGAEATSTFWNIDDPEQLPTLVYQECLAGLAAAWGFMGKCRDDLTQQEYEKEAAQRAVEEADRKVKDSIVDDLANLGGTVAA